jgi:hypothetical protein
MVCLMCSVCPPNRKGHHCETRSRALIACLGGWEADRRKEVSIFYYIAGYFLRYLDALCIILGMQTASDMDKVPFHIPTKRDDPFYVACPRPPPSITTCTLSFVMPRLLSFCVNGRILMQEKWLDFGHSSPYSSI